MSEIPHELLLAQAMEGDRLAMRRLLLHHHDRLVAAVAGKLPRELQGSISAEDVCQEAYVAAIRNISSFKPSDEGGFFAWLRTIADNKLADAVRARRAVKRGGGKEAVEAVGREGSSVIALLDMVAVDGRTPSQSVVRHEIAVAVREAMDRLSEEYRQVVRLRYVQGLPVADAAKEMGRSEGAIKMLCSRALRQLAEEIGDPARFLTQP